MQSDIEATQMIAKLSFNCFWEHVMKITDFDISSIIYLHYKNLNVLAVTIPYATSFLSLKEKKCFNYYDLWLTCRKETKAMLIHRQDKTLSSCVTWQDGVIFLFRKLRYVKGNNSNSYLTSDRATIIVIWWILKWLTHTTVSREILYYNTYL